jgi:hypothetical protein
MGTEPPQRVACILCDMLTTYLMQVLMPLINSIRIRRSILTLIPFIFTAGAEQLVPSEIVNRLDALEIESIDLNIVIALDTLVDLGEQQWYSSSNQVNGTIKVLRSFEFDTSMCREIQIMIKQEGSTDQRTISFCREVDLQWQRMTYRFKNQGS